MGSPCTTRLRVIEALARHPEGMTFEELVHDIGICKDRVRSVIRYARNKEGTAVFRVERYDPVEGKGGRYQPVWVLGPGDDAPPILPNYQRAKTKKKAVNKRWRDANKALVNATARVKRGATVTASPWAGLI